MIVFAPSHPTSNSEGTAEQAQSATEGRPIFARERPGSPVSLGGATYESGLAATSSHSRGSGPGGFASGASREFFFVPARTRRVPRRPEAGRACPPVSRMHRVWVSIAASVAGIADQLSLVSNPEPDDILESVARVLIPWFNRIPGPGDLTCSWCAGRAANWWSILFWIAPPVGIGLPCTGYSQTPGWILRPSHTR